MATVATQRRKGHRVRGRNHPGFLLADVSKLTRADLAGCMWVVVAQCRRCKMDLRMDAGSVIDGDVRELRPMLLTMHEERCR